jgi:hypothetical protein
MGTDEEGDSSAGTDEEGDSSARDDDETTNDAPREATLFGILHRRGSAEQLEPFGQR